MIVSHKALRRASQGVWNRMAQKSVPRHAVTNLTLSFGSTKVTNDEEGDLLFP